MFDACACVQLCKGRARIISKYEMNTFLSERGSLIIYLNKVKHSGCTFCFPAWFLLVMSFVLPCRFLTKNQKRSHLGSIRGSKLVSCSQPPCPSMSITTVSLKASHILQAGLCSQHFPSCSRNILCEVLPPREDSWTAAATLQEWGMHLCWR